MLRGVALGLAVLGLTGTIALGQSVSIDESGGLGYGDFGDGTFTLDVTIADVGVIADFQLTIDSGDAVTLSDATIAFPAFDVGPPVTVGISSAAPPIYSWSKFIMPNGVDSAGGVLALSFDVTVAAGDDTNTFLGINAGNSFVSSDGAAASFDGGLAVGGQLVPEPATMALLLAGVGGGLVARRRRRS